MIVVCLLAISHFSQFRAMLSVSASHLADPSACLAWQTETRMVSHIGASRLCSSTHSITTPDDTYGCKPVEQRYRNWSQLPLAVSIMWGGYAQSRRPLWWRAWNA